MDQHTVFLDESGNTGSNLLDTTQPLFTFVGIGIRNDKVSHVTTEVNELRIKHNIRSKELKGTKIFKRGKDRIIREIAELLITHNFSLFINIAEKKYVIASFIESDFFDPVFNDKCDNTWTHPLKERTDNANFLYKYLTDETIKACGNFFSTGQSIEEAYWLIYRDIKDKEYKLPLAEILLGAESHLKSLARITKRVVSDDSTIHAPNFFTFCDLMNKIEHFYSSSNQECFLCFDSSRQFNVSFIKIYNALKNAPPAALIAPERLPFLAGYQSIKDIMVEDSKDNLLLQCADLLATSINKVMCKILTYSSNTKFTDAELFILVLIFFHWKDFGKYFCSYVCSGELLYKMYLALKDNQPQ